tara:strand:- start:792 stop:1085 length:294 start_codon:yes stop_codon:yes gene_type:complete
MGIRKRTFSVRKMYTVNSDYRLIEGQGIVKMWYINGIPFTFDEVDQPSIELIDACSEKMCYTMEDLYRHSQYLIMESCHPIVFEMTDVVKCEEELPF